MLPIRNVTYTKCYINEMLPLRNVIYTKCYLYEMFQYEMFLDSVLSVRNVTEPLHLEYYL